MTFFFDLDGTLIDSKKRHYILLKKIVDSCCIRNYHFEEKELMNYKSYGHNNVEFMIEILGIEKNIALDINNRWINEIEQKEYIDYDVLFDDVYVVLDYIKQNNCNIIFLTSRQNEDMVYYQLEKFDIKKYSTDVLISNKKNGDKYSLIKNKIRVGDVVVGDTEIDYECAKKANIQGIMLNYGFRNKIFWENRNVKSEENLFECIKRII